MPYLGGGAQLHTDPSAVTPFESLLTAAIEGADWAWERLYRDFSPKLRGYLVAQGASDPDDLLGEVWLQVARNIRGFQGDENGFRSWIFVVAHHRVIDERRRRRRRPEARVEDDTLEDLAGVTPSAEDHALESVAGDAVMTLLSALTGDQRDVLTLRIFGDLTIEQVAEAVGKPPGAVKALQRRGLRRLKKKIDEGVPL